MALPSFFRQIWTIRHILVVLFTPIIFLPFPLAVDYPEARCAYVIIIMAVYWTTEAIPIAVTSLLPIVLFPIMGVLTAKQTSGAYMNDTSMLFFGGLMLAVAIEVWDIHKRLALLVLMKVGSEPKWLLLGIMGVTWFLSMWISNTATTAMMITIVQAILQQIKIADASTAEDNVKAYEVTNPDTKANLNENKHSESPKEQKGSKGAKVNDVFHTRISKCMCLAVAYSANIGGIASLTGTGPNLILKGQADIVFNDYGLTSPISFSTWMVYGLPLSLIVVVILWFWLQAFFLRCKKKDGKDTVAEVIESEYRKLGKINFPQITVVICFTLLVILWITRDLGGIGGWGTYFFYRTVSDSTPAILIGILLFILPTAVPNVFCFRKSGDCSNAVVKPLLTWQDLHEKMPWSLYLLLGGGYAIAKASQESGLSEMVGTSLRVFKDLNPWLMLMILCYIITFLTEITSNTAISTLMMPILASLALSLQVNPLYFMFPAAITTSFAFMLPVATPPNAIVFSFGQVRVIDMVLAGLFMNIVSVPVLLLATATWGNSFFHFTDVDPAFLAFNETTTLATI
ncbi:hypothetical protein LOTGIDRAFT_104288 [Lottia gigantea]|uniref:Citrate transporter-like domain-containing protein n=1 Tax=Lottia gigantea TaxID=225164 RepID=V4A1V0_LOTGI|nr:hypothetical protein LOTGIDRAFT_104288 [Lottia gigantea]ESO97808.1 hypothetical protein LOTGIDRAFT_104288 [Lottia gigantea]